MNENTNLLELCQFASSYQNLPFGDCRNFHRYLIWILEWPRAILKVVTIQSQPWGIDKILIGRKITTLWVKRSCLGHAGCYVYTPDHIENAKIQKYEYWSTDMKEYKNTKAYKNSCWCEYDHPGAHISQLSRPRFATLPPLHLKTPNSATLFLSALKLWEHWRLKYTEVQILKFGHNFVQDIETHVWSWFWS